MVAATIAIWGSNRQAVRSFSLTRQRSEGRIYYGWVMLLALATTQVTSWGILYYSFAVFLAPMQEDLGWSIAQITGAYSLALLISGLAAIPFGRWLDRHGPRPLMTAGSVLATLLVVAWAAVDSLLGFYLIWAAIGVIMAAVFYEPVFVIVANWFDRLRGRALTMLTFIGGFASAIFIPLASWLVQSYGWRSALLILAAVLALGTIPIHALMLRQHPRDMGLLPDGASTLEADTPANVSLPRVSVTLHDALRDRVFWWIMALCTTAARAIAPIGAGLLYTGMNSYTPVLWLLVIMSALALVAAIRAKPAFTPLPGSV